ncbi:MAG TPA: SRPBCC family protein [Acidimicrobiia bacterium]|nr:SRPBCC family protein [Acidimicrobiia bacterium]
MGVTVAVLIDAPLQKVWTAVADLGSHVEWMADAERIEFTGPQQQGVGTLMDVFTRIGPLTTTDVMEVTAWEPPRRIAVVHKGLVSGTGEFRLDPVAGGVVVTWVEHLRFPWHFGGPLGAALAQPLFHRIWKGNLTRLQTLLTET